MIAAIIEQDHDAGREFFADIGNATQPAWEGRADGMAAFANLWERHGITLDRAVAPHLSAVPQLRTDLDALLTQQRLVVERARDLVRRASGRDADGRWLTDFEGLKALFDDQCQRESSHLLPVIRDRVPPEEVAEMTRAARALREQRRG
ncbi:hemerythrin domain-containing protein [Azospirillum rugosum]|uniref:Hemerythrin-like domain-containing protein n=1 Tax=Azospirillum rugosum TaxID=416170 RepID=A0ABS4SVY2_9PROT|nr:hemerythrin domain-containing protein [Azospirillum rugosum]MBP2296731.1 hypothetical protein [Azospirillum rugosum]MDQ0530456.1 hypothetical protein [Azospirillum rugosum]